jgi:protein-disulfide isomerase
MTRFKFPQITTENFTSTLTLMILCVQVFLLILLTLKVGRLEQAFISVTGGGVPSASLVIDRTPDEQGQVLGSKDALVTVVEFSDFECPACAAAEEGVKEMLAKYQSQIRFVYRHFPLTGIHSNAFRAAEASECANEQGKFWEMHDYLFSNQTALGEENLFRYASEISLNIEQFTACMESGSEKPIIEQDLADGQKYGVDGTPTFFVNNMMVVGGVSELEDMVQEALTRP